MTTILTYLSYLDRKVDLWFKRFWLRKAAKIARMKCESSGGKTYWVLRDINGSLRVVNNVEINILTGIGEMPMRYRSFIHRKRDALYIASSSGLSANQK